MSERNRPSRERLKGRATGKNLLDMVPTRTTDAQWYADDGGLTRVRRKKFHGRIGRFFCKLLGKPDYLTIKLDLIGSAVWGLCDDKRDIRSILCSLEMEFPNEKELGERLKVFFFHLEKGGMVHFA
ncbi:MAG: hypothetical protein CVT48_04875 [Thermoplasmata archaeon HGW-Thermoplasmata-1]|nr:MAG: hypothetical protein CVT48_04875 [Thermoplasmata archaeon HGW-Thermoplasmata-1]